MPEVTVKLPTPHPKQKYILSNAKRFNHLRCGRRFGKTELIKELLLPAVEEGWSIGIWYPTYKDASDVWLAIKNMLGGSIKRKDETLKKIQLHGGGKIDIWAMVDPDSGQGFKYNRAIIDESAKALKFMTCWQETIRPTLTDFKGDAWIMSRPKPNCGFKALEDNHKNRPDWGFFHFTTYDNPYIDNDEIEAAKLDLDSRTFEQEYLAEYVDPDANYFFYAFDESIHTGKCSVLDHLPIKLSFDFNIDPFATIAYQTPTKDTMNVIKEIRLPNSDIYAVCDRIRALYPNAFFVVTGDRTGYNQTGVVRGKTSYWRIIKDELKLSDSQIKLRSKNLDLVESRVLCNSALQHKEVSIDLSCDNLIRDSKYAKVDDKGVLIKDRGKNQNDFADTFRYAMDAEWPELTRF